MADMENTVATQGSMPLDLRERARHGLARAEQADDAQRLETLEGLLGELGSELEGHQDQASQTRQ